MQTGKESSIHGAIRNEFVPWQQGVGWRSKGCACSKAGLVNVQPKATPLRCCMPDTLSPTFSRRIHGGRSCSALLGVAGGDAWLLDDRGRVSAVGERFQGREIRRHLGMRCRSFCLINATHAPAASAAGRAAARPSEPTGSHAGRPGARSGGTQGEGQRQFHATAVVWDE